MFTAVQKEELAREIVQSTHESIDLPDLGSRVLPQLDRLLDTSTSLLYQSNNTGEIVPIIGSLSEGAFYYSRYYFASDPLQKTVISTNPKVLIGSTMPNWKEYLGSCAFNECTTRLGMDYFLFLRVSQCPVYEPGMVGLMFGRTFRQTDFNDHDLSLVKKVLPALEAMARRNERLDPRLKIHSYVETLMEFAHSATVILDLNGAYIWASEQAEALLHISSNGCKRVPQELELAAKRLGVYLNRGTSEFPPPTSVSVTMDNEKPLKGELRLVRNRHGGHCVVFELEDIGVTPQVAVVAASYKLTKAETEVLQLIAMGLNDQEIGSRLFIAFPTVRSHVSHILSKLDVASRTQAALIAHGHKITALD